jgi:diacylglycerol kinase (ATP)
MAATPLVSRDFPAAVFVNPLAGGGRAMASVRELQRVFVNHKVFAEFVFPGNAAELESRAQHALSAGSKLLLGVGGDGTFQALANATYGKDVVIGILPSGGGNDVAAALGLRAKSPVSAAQAILYAAPCAIDALWARTADGRERLYLGGGGLGLDADAAQHAGGAYRRLPGRLRYVAAAVRALREFRPLRVRAEFPDSSSPPLEASVLLAAALNTPTYGAGVRLAPSADLHDGLLSAVLVQDLSKPRVTKLLPRLLVTGELPEKHVQRFNVRRVRFIPDRDCMFHGDGEVLGPAPVDIEVLPGALRVLAPLTPAPLSAGG